MAKEKAAYRDNLESILEFLKGKYGSARHMLKVKDVQEYTGFGYDFVKREYMPDKCVISAETLARTLAD